MRKTIRLDDIDGSPDAKEYGFPWAGTQYEIDLSDENAAGLTAALRPFIQAARKVVTRPEQSPVSASSVPASLTHRANTQWGPIAEKVVADITSGTLRAGDRITAPKIIEWYGTNQSTGARVLRRLCTRGYLICVRQRYYVADRSADADPGADAEAGP